MFPGAGLYTGSGKDSTAMFDKGEKNGQSKGVQREVKELEMESERQRQKGATVSQAGRERCTS